MILFLPSLKRVQRKERTGGEELAVWGRVHCPWRTTVAGVTGTISEMPRPMGMSYSCPKTDSEGD